MNGKAGQADSDFRVQLYDRYVSTFKSERAGFSEERAEAYGSYCRHKILPLIAAAKRDAPVLELGCGAGNMLALLREDGFTSVKGIDISPEQVDVAKRRGLDVEVGSAAEVLAEAEGRYGLIVGMDFVEHFTKPELLEMLPLVRRALKPEGLLLLQTPNGQGLFPGQVIHGDLSHMSVLTPGSVAQMLTLAGFEDVRCFETGPVGDSFSGRTRVVLWAAIRVMLNALRRIEAGKSQSIWTENMLCVCVRGEEPVDS